MTRLHYPGPLTWTTRGRTTMHGGGSPVCGTSEVAATTPVVADVTCKPCRRILAHAGKLPAGPSELDRLRAESARLRDESDSWRDKALTAWCAVRDIAIASDRFVADREEAKREIEKIKVSFQRRKTTGANGGSS